MNLSFLYKLLFIIGSLFIILSAILSWIEHSRRDREKNEMIKKLQVETSKASRWISISYDFKGTKRETKAGHINLIQGKEIAVFKTMSKLQNEKNYIELVTVCENQIKETPEWLTPYLFLGVAYDNLDKKDKAIQMYEYVKENSFGDSEYADAYYFLGQIYAIKGDFSKAIGELKSYLKYKPENAIVRYNLGLAYDKIGLIDEAIEEYKLALKYKVDFAWAYYNLGLDYANMGLINESIEQYKLAIKYKPDFSDAYDNLGHIYYKMGKTNEAIEEYKLAIKYEPGHVNAHNNLGAAYANKGLNDEAIEEYKLAIKYQDDFAKAYYNLGYAYGRKGMNKEAIQAFENFKKYWKGDTIKIEEVEKLIKSLKKED